MTETISDNRLELAVKKSDVDARRTRLREFQSQLLERMQAARSGSDTSVSQLGVMIGQTHCLLDLQQVGEIVSVGAVTKVPLTQDWYLGLANIRGSLTSVIDLARFQGFGLSAIDKQSRVVAFAAGLSFNSALLVSRVMGLHNLSDMQLRTDSAADAAPWSARQYTDRESRIWTQLDLSLIVQDPRFLHVGL
ncbi:MAG TPA: chemotaxis protein CheW [Burkholderiaceae bacterium]|nr:chemotaxis protein CheW [Burkholderiaceae bacterium]